MPGIGLRGTKLEGNWTGVATLGGSVYNPSTSPCCSSWEDRGLSTYSGVKRTGSRAVLSERADLEDYVDRSQQGIRRDIDRISLTGVWTFISGIVVYEAILTVWGGVGGSLDGEGSGGSAI